MFVCWSVRVNTCMYELLWKPEDNLRFISQEPATSTGSLTILLPKWATLAGQPALRHTFLPLLVLGFFLPEFWALNPGPCVCSATEPFIWSMPRHGKVVCSLGYFKFVRGG